MKVQGSDPGATLERLPSCALCAQLGRYSAEPVRDITRIATKSRRCEIMAYDVTMMGRFISHMYDFMDQIHDFTPRPES